MKVGIVGSRRRKDRKTVEYFIDELNPADDVVISGGCRGVDTWAELRALVRGMQLKIHRPEVHAGMKYFDIVRAMYARNRKIAEDCDILVAFVAPDRKGGTENTIRYAVALGKKVVIK